MTEEIENNIFRIGVPLPDNPLRELNSYYIRGNDRDLLIDTGFRNEVCQQALESGLSELGSDPERRDVLLTHLHSDHSGMADLFVGPGRNVYLSGTDLAYLHEIKEGDIRTRQRKRYQLEGMTAEMIRQIDAINPADQQSLRSITDQFTALKEGDVLTVGNYDLETIVVPGHTPGNTVFFCRKQGILFCGDHVLFDITPNITFWVDVEDSLGDYLTQLERIRELPVRLALPGHRKTGDFKGRIDHLLAHHQTRLEEARRIVEETPGLTAYDITARMTWRIRARNWEDFPLTQKWFAMGECISHLDYLTRRGVISRETGEERIRYFAAPV